MSLFSFIGFFLSIQHFYFVSRLHSRNAAAFLVLFHRGTLATATALYVAENRLRGKGIKWAQSPAYIPKSAIRRPSGNALFFGTDATKSCESLLPLT